MEIGKTLQAKGPKEFRNWLSKNHKTASEIWLVFFNKNSSQKGITYTQALDEALCFGWIDSIVKKYSADSRVQRFTPRRAKSPVSPLNKEKIKRLVAEGKMTEAGLAAAPGWDDKFNVPANILKTLKKDPEVWKNFQKFPESYKTVRISWICDLPDSRPEERKKRLDYFLKMTRQNKMFGTSI